jgi:hypothetical protein
MVILEYLNKPYIIHEKEEDILTVQERDGKLKPEEEDFLHPEVKMMMPCHEESQVICE